MTTEHVTEITTMLMSEAPRRMVAGRSRLVDVDDLGTVISRLCGLLANPENADEAGDHDSLLACSPPTG